MIIIIVIIIKAQTEIHNWSRHTLRWLYYWSRHILRWLYNWTRLILRRLYNWSKLTLRWLYDWPRFILRWLYYWPRIITRLNTMPHDYTSVRESFVHCSAFACNCLTSHLQGTFFCSLMHKETLFINVSKYITELRIIARKVN